MKNKKHIVVIGGGTGVFVMLTGLRKRFENISAIVTMSDDGGSTGVLREEFGVLPPGDIRRAIVALSSSDNEMLAKLFNYRFEEGSGLSGHSLGNLMITAMERLTGSFDTAIEEIGKIFSIKGNIFPVTLDHARLVAELENGEIIKGETNIDIPKHDGNLKIKHAWLEPGASVYGPARKAISTADAVIIGPGDLYTSLVPNLLVSGMAEALAKTRAKKIYVSNLMTKFGETNGFRISDFIHTLESFLKKNILDYALVNKTRPTFLRMRPYVNERAEFVEFDPENIQSTVVPIVSDVIRSRGYIRHDPDKVTKLIEEII